MSQSEPKNWWNSNRLHAAELIAARELTEEEIAQKLGIGRATLTRWESRAEFQSRVAEIRVETAARIRANTIQSRERRLKRLQARVEKMDALIEARALDLADIPGGNTGLLVREVKHFDTVYKFDAALLRELREHEKQAAIEVGEWQEKQQVEHTGLDEFAGITEQLFRRLDGLATSAPAPADHSTPES